MSNNIKCKICGQETTLGRLSVHIKYKHKEITVQEYYDKYLANDKGVCPICGDALKFGGFTSGYFKTCGKKSCSAQLSNINGKENQIKGCLERNKKWKEEITDSGLTRQQEIILKGKEKRDAVIEEIGKKISKALKKTDSDGLTSFQRTMLEKHGVDNPMKVPEIAEKCFQTYEERSGFSHPMHNPEVIDSMKDTMLDRYGVDNYVKTDDYKERMKTYNFEKIKPKILRFFSDNNLELESELDETYEKNTSKLTYRCLECNSVYTQRWCNMLEYWICRKCYPKSRCKAQIELEEFLTANNIKFEPECRRLISNPDTDRNLELDLYMPEFNLAIEYDGLHWHNDSVQLDPNYHFKKTRLCFNEGIKLIHIFEDEWIHKREVVLDRLKYELNLLSNKIHARKCIVKEIKFSDCDHFLDNNHLQGSTPASTYLGMFHEKTLVAVLTIVKNYKGEYELKRFCTLNGYSIPGAFSKFLSYVKNHYPDIKQLISFCDLRWFTGNGYKKCGFKLERLSKPNYWYIDFSTCTRLNRMNFQKSKLVNMDYYSEHLTEQEIMDLNGYKRIYDCGNLKFILNM